MKGRVTDHLTLETASTTFQSVQPPPETHPEVLNLITAALSLTRSQQHTNKGLLAVRESRISSFLLAFDQRLGI